jgi:DNA invertase Pin-like site-specific DNA recombinase
MNQVSRSPVAISYARFSSLVQAKGTSEARQQRDFALWIAEHPMYEGQSFVDRGISAYSGRNRKKGSLAAILSLIKEGHLKDGDCLVIEAIDRLSRQETTEALRLILDILSAGVSIVTLEDNQKYDKASVGGSGAYILIGKVQGAHDYSKRLGMRISAAHLNKRAKARADKATAKLVTVSWIKDGKLHEPFAGLVRKAVELYLKGFGHRGICIELQPLIEADSLLKARYEKPLHASTIKRWLRSPELIGDWNSTEGLIHDLFEPLLTEDEYQQVQRLLKERTKKPTKQTKYLLAGLVKCNVCGSSFHTRAQYPHPTKDAPKGSKAYENRPLILYCNCSGYLKSGSCTNNTTWPYQVLTSIVKAYMGERIGKAAQDKPLPNDDSAQILGKVADFESKLKRYADLYARLGDPQYLDAATDVKIKIDDLKAQLIEERQAQDLRRYRFEQFHRGIKEFEALDTVEQNHMLKRLGFEIHVHGKKAWPADYPDQPYELIRRSQKFSAYIVKVTNLNSHGELATIYSAVGTDGKLIGNPVGHESVESLLTYVDRTPMKPSEENFSVLAGGIGNMFS